MNLIQRLKGNTLVRHTGIYTISSIVNAAIPFFLLPILTRYLTPEDYGIASMFTLMVTIISPFVGININAAITRRYYDKDTINFWEYVFNGIIILVVSTFFVSILFGLFSNFIESITKFPKEFLWSVIVYTFCMSLTNVLLALWQIQTKALQFGFQVNLKTLFNASLSIMLVIFWGLGWQGRLYGQVISESLFAVISVGILLKNKWLKLTINKKYIKDALMYGLPLIPHALSGSILSMTDRLFITNMVGLGATGIYTVGYQVGSIISLITLSFNTAFVPWLFEKLTENKEETKLKIVKFTYIYYAVILTMAVILGFLAPVLLNVFIGKNFAGSSLYVIWIAVGYAFNGMYLMVVNYIFYAEKNGLLSTVTFATAILNVILNYFFIKAFGAVGAAQATTLIFAIKFILVWYLSAKVYKMPWGSIGRKLSKE